MPLYTYAQCSCAALCASPAIRRPHYPCVNLLDRREVEDICLWSLRLELLKVPLPFTKIPLAWPLLPKVTKY